LNFSQKILDAVIKNSLELDCINVTLTQNVETNPVVFKGPGTIFQDENGTLRLKMYHAFQDLPKEIFPLDLEYTPGEIIRDKHYSSLRAMDIHGNVWTARRVSVNRRLSFPATGTIIKTSLTEIVNTEERKISNEKSHLTVFVKGRYSIPCNEAEDLPEGGWILNTSEFNVENINFKFKKDEQSLEIKASGLKQNMPDFLENHMIEALSVIFGCMVSPVFTIWSHDNISETKIRPVDLMLSESPLPRPIEHTTPESLDNFKAFIVSYLQFSMDRETYTPLIGYWHKIYSAYQGRIENAALALTVSIEGVLKEYFQGYGHAEQDILKKAEEAKKAIDNLEVIDRIKNMILKSLERIKRPSPKSALIDISRQGWFPKQLVDVWEKLRNRSTHADQIDYNKEELQDYMNQFNSCLNLFYRLIFIIISYRGKFINHTLKGWPEHEFKAELPDEPGTLLQ
jgi:hypothetical protein